jgi:DNA processing protein
MPDAATWALAFTLLDWPERQKAGLWEAVQQGSLEAVPAPIERDLERVRGSLAERRKEAESLGARLLLPGDPSADRLLAALPYPVALWVRGTLPPERGVLAIVGSRQARRDGLERARRWARELTSAGLAVLSGLARGIDAAAHAGALEAGPTWGVLGSGLLHPYPGEHRPLMDRMVAAGGGVLTPFPPEAEPLKWHFPRRNLLLVAWSLGVLVVEATVKSGSLVTAKLALDHGKELWVCPGAPENPLAAGPNRLLREGSARICLSVNDLLEDLTSLAL